MAFEVNRTVRTFVLFPARKALIVVSIKHVLTYLDTVGRLKLEIDLAVD
jgi:hypothetical protein